MKHESKLQISAGSLSEQITLVSHALGLRLKEVPHILPYLISLVVIILSLIPVFTDAYDLFNTRIADKLSNSVKTQEVQLSLLDNKSQGNPITPGATGVKVESPRQLFEAYLKHVNALADELSSYRENTLFRNYIYAAVVIACVALAIGLYFHEGICRQRNGYSQAIINYYTLEVMREAADLNDPAKLSCVQGRIMSNVDAARKRMFQPVVGRVQCPVYDEEFWKRLDILLHELGIMAQSVNLFEEKANGTPKAN